jgi:hypothetical protein
MVGNFVVLVAFNVCNGGKERESLEQGMDRCEDVIFGVEGGRGRGETEGAQLINFLDQTLIITEDAGQWDGVEVMTVEAEMVNEEEAGDHAVAFGTV